MLNEYKSKVNKTLMNGGSSRFFGAKKFDSQSNKQSFRKRTPGAADILKERELVYKLAKKPKRDIEKLLRIGEVIETEGSIGGYGVTFATSNNPAQQDPNTTSANDPNQIDSSEIDIIGNDEGETIYL